MKKIAFCIPTFPPHYGNTRKLYNSYIHYELYKQSDFWLVFTNQEEKEIFEKLCNTTNSIIYDSSLGVDRDGIINKKKLYALNILKEQYEYVIILDAESIFIKNVDILYLCNLYFNNKVLYGNEVNNENIDIVNAIENSCKRFYKLDENKSELNTNLYLWFNQLCIYKSSTIPIFFKVIDYDSNIKNLKFFDFDYYIYMYYLILYENFTIENIGITCNFGVCENTTDSFIIKLDKYKNIPFMSSTKLMIDYINNENLFVIIHLDRIVDNNIISIRNYADYLNNEINLLKDYNNYLNNEINLLKDHNNYLNNEINLLKDHNNYLNNEINLLKDHNNYLNNEINLLKDYNNYLNNILTNIVNTICWWIPIKKWRDNFRNRIIQK